MSRLLLLVATILTLHQAGRCQEFAYFRCNNSTKTLQFVYIGDLTFYDFYAETRSSTCGLRAGAFTGKGTFGDPYILEINLSGGLLTQQPDCGVKQSTDSTLNLVMIKQKTCEANSSTDQRYVSSCKVTLPPSNYTTSTDVNIYTVLIYVQQYPTVLTKYDYTYQLTCNFSNNATITLQSQITTVVSQNPTQVLSQRPTSASLSFVSGSGSAGLSSLVVGDQIRLVAQLLDSPATGLRVTSCTASPGQGMLPVIQVLNTKGYEA
uniref:ZP domain-containing protein n=1 Tax=Biomphalaria glabrata TaxID=6526 RepID=A0A2C9M140_BIOGL